MFSETIEEAPPTEDLPPEKTPEAPKTTTSFVSPATAAETCQSKANQIFIVHGKHTVPMEQLKKILDDPFKIPYKVAVDEANAGRPISQKVADLMHECNSAIVIFTADEEYTDTKGDKVFRPSDNAIYELGAASILYGKKIIILKEKGVMLASDFSDLGYISFEKDNLASKTSDLIRELISFGLVKVVIA